MRECTHVPASSRDQQTHSEGTQAHFAIGHSPPQIGAGRTHARNLLQRCWSSSTTGPPTRCSSQKRQQPTDEQNGQRACRFRCCHARQNASASTRWPSRIHECTLPRRRPSTRLDAASLLLRAETCFDVVARFRGGSGTANLAGSFDGGRREARRDVARAPLGAERGRTATRDCQTFEPVRMCSGRARPKAPRFPSSERARPWGPAPPGAVAGCALMPTALRAARSVSSMAGGKDDPLSDAGGNRGRARMSARRGQSPRVRRRRAGAICVHVRLRPILHVCPASSANGRARTRAECYTPHALAPVPGRRLSSSTSLCRTALFQKACARAVGKLPGSMSNGYVSASASQLLRSVRVGYVAFRRLVGQTAEVVELVVIRQENELRRARQTQSTTCTGGASASGTRLFAVVDIGIASFRGVSRDVDNARNKEWVQCCVRG